MVALLKVIIALLSIISIVAVLLQPSKGDAGGALGGSSQSVFGSTGGTTFLFRLTMWCFAIVASLCIFLARSHLSDSRKSVIDSLPLSALPAAPAPAAPATTTPAAPVTSAPVAPAAPAKK